ncbi:MAG: hypothetical protein AB7U29_18850 [Desulfobulbus sp.]
MQMFYMKDCIKKLRSVTEWNGLERIGDGRKTRLEENRGGEGLVSGQFGIASKPACDGIYDYSNRRGIAVAGRTIQGILKMF